MKHFFKLILFVGVLLFSHFGNCTLSFMDADSIINSGSATTSANSFYSYISSDTTLSMSEFLDLYIPTFSSNSMDSQSFSTLLDNYTSAVKSASYTTAQNYLVQLTAASFANSDGSYVADTLDAAQNPWPGGGIFLYSKTQGPLDFIIVGSFIAEFKNLYSHLVSGSSTTTTKSSSDSNPVGPSGTSSSSIATKMLAEKQNAISAITGYESDAKQALTSEVSQITEKMNNIEELALADSDIGSSATKQKYIGEIQSEVTTGEASLEQILQEYTSPSGKIKVQQESSDDVLELLSSQGGSVSLELVYKQKISTQVSTSDADINSAYNSSVTTINDLKETISEKINDAKGESSSGDSDSGESAGEEIAHFFEQPIDDILSGLTSFAVATIVYKIFGGKAPKLSDHLKGVPDSYKSLADRMGDNIIKVVDSDNPGQAIQDMFAKAPSSVVKEFAGKMREELGISEEQFNNALASVSDASNNLGKLGDFANQLKTVAGDVADRVPGASKESVMEQVGKLINAGESITNSDFAAKVANAVQQGADTLRTDGGTTTSSNSTRNSLEGQQTGEDGTGRIATTTTTSGQEGASTTSVNSSEQSNEQRDSQKTSGSEDNDDDNNGSDDDDIG